MRLQSAYPVVVTDKMAECRDFYVRHFGFEVAFEASWFVYLSAGGGQPYAIAFMTPDHPSRPPGPEKFDGKGLFLTLQVDDAAKEFERLRKAGVAVAYPVADEPWGQRRFGVVDPSGLWVDVVQQTESAPGYWDPYMRVEQAADPSRN
ncbi:glyoxalase [Luteimonas gilva]|uniref:Glyoxalase n=2 Tax=Luteimonas gilva TaxID=2572684 RepID=A0A4U5JYI1_9GAMM|nr:glyoxalase [Luteimonas gilva]